MKPRVYEIRAWSNAAPHGEWTECLLWQTTSPDQGRVAAAPGMPRATRVSGLPRGSLVRLYSSAKSASLFSRSVSVISGGSSSGHSSFQLTATRAAPPPSTSLHLVFLGMFEDVVDRVNESLCVYHFGSFLLPNAFGAISIISYTTGRWKYQAETDS